MSTISRRSFLAGTTALATLHATSQLVRAATTRPPAPKGKAEHCILFWLGGGMSQIDTFDPKKRGSSKSAPRRAGTDYETIATATPGVKYTEHLSRTAQLTEHVTAIRSVYHRVVDEHAFATNLVHTGRMVSGTAVFPSLGAVVGHQLGAASEDVPPYLLIGYPNASRGPGFLGPKHGSVYLIDVESGPAGFARPDGVAAARFERRERLVGALAQPKQDVAWEQYREMQVQAERWAGPSFMRHFDLTKESSAVRQGYGSEFGQRCLLARRLVEGGVRFVEVSHNLNFINGTGWDTHFEGHVNQHVLISDLDLALAALIRDLEEKRLLEKTLIVVATEFGRPGEFDVRGGRAHQSSAFTMVLAGGGLKHCGAYGVTDDLSKRIVEHPVSIPDFHATIYAALGIDPAKELFADSRPIPITDQGKPITRLFG